ncbi:MAG: TonB family protein [Gammaproteobacteria bacterium]|nr:TonB family protein [Gammaproteobacteria bacterium]
MTKITIALLSLYSLNSFADISDTQIKNAEQTLASPVQHNEEEQKKEKIYSQFDAQENFKLLRIIHKSPLVLPPSFLAHPETGQVLLWVSIDDHGNVTSVDIHNSSGNYDLDMAAETAVRHYKYQPYINPKTGEATASKDKLLISYPESQESINSATVTPPATQLSDIIAAAKQGDPVAENHIGMFYFTGNNTKQDFAQALIWFEKAARQNLPEAENNLGNMYLQGKGIAVDYTQAFHWFEKAAHQNLPDAENTLASMFYMGQGVAKDDTQAFIWLKKAADQEFENAELNIGAAYRSGVGVKQDYTQALNWFEKAAYKGNAAAQNALGLMYYEGQSVPKNDSQALAWFQKSANQDFAPAKENIKKINKSKWSF